MDPFDFNMNGAGKKAKTSIRTDADSSPNIRSHSLYTIDEILGNSSSLRTPPQSGMSSFESKAHYGLITSHPMRVCDDNG